MTSAGFGGASMHVLQLLKFMRSLGHEVALVSAPDRRLITEAKNAGAKVFENPYFVRRFHILNDVKAFIPVYKAIRDFKPDIIHAHSTKAGVIARFWSAVLGIKSVIFTAHGWVFTEGKKYIERWITAQVEKLMAKFTAKIICVSEFDKNLALKFSVAPENKLITIHNGVDPMAFAESLKSKNLKKIDNEICITFVGRLAPPKDIFLLIDAVQSIDGIKVLIVGDGELRDKVEKYILKKNLDTKIKLLGERADVPDILAQSDIFVLPSRWEGLPLTIIEAMMAKLPVVATAVGGVPELVDDGITGILVPPADVEALRVAIKKLIEYPDLRIKMGENGYKKAVEKFKLENMLVKTLNVYYEVLNSLKQNEVQNVKVN